MSTCEKNLPQDPATEFPLEFELTWTAPAAWFTGQDKAVIATKDEILHFIHNYSERAEDWSLDNFIDDWELEEHTTVTFGGVTVFAGEHCYSNLEADGQLWRMTIKSSGIYKMRDTETKITAEQAVAALRFENETNHEVFVKAGLYENPEIGLQELRVTVEEVG